MRVFITASSGVGKSAIVNELKNRGYTAYDTDDRGLRLTRLEDSETGKPVAWPKGYIDWRRYSWNVNEEKLQKILANDKTVFLCGIVSNQEKLYHYFDVLIALAIEPAEHERRLRSRPKRDFGDDEQNIRQTLEKYSEHMAKFKAADFTVIDNTQSVSQTVDQIETFLKSNER